MKMIHHEVEVIGPGASRGHCTPASMGEAFRLVQPLVNGAVSMAFRYRSAPRGPRPPWLTSASGVDFTDMSWGSRGNAVFHFNAPRLGDAASSLYRQKELFKTRPRKDDTAFDLVGDVLADVGAENRDSHRFDTQLLSKVNCFRRAMKCGVEALIFRGDRLPQDGTRILNRTVSEVASRLQRETPAPRRVRVRGKLDMIRDSDGAFALLIESGQSVPCVWLPDDRSVLGKYWCKPVVIEGVAVFCASESLLRLEAEAIAAAGSIAGSFSAAPKPIAASLDKRSLRKRQTARTGLSAVFGQWPGEETEEELLAALKEMRSPV